MCVDEVLRWLFGDDVDAELGALLLVECLHHSLEQSQEFLTYLVLTGESGDGETAVRKDSGIAFVQPQVITGAQSKKGRLLGSTDFVRG